MLGKCILCVRTCVPKDNLFLAIILTGSKTSLGSVKKCKTSHLVFSLLSFGVINGGGGSGGRIYTISYVYDLYNTHALILHIYLRTLCASKRLIIIYNPCTM